MKGVRRRLARVTRREEACVEPEERRGEEKRGEEERRSEQERSEGARPFFGQVSQSACLGCQQQQPRACPFVSGLFRPDRLPAGWPSVSHAADQRAAAEGFRSQRALACGLGPLGGATARGVFRANPRGVPGSCLIQRRQSRDIATGLSHRAAQRASEQGRRGCSEQALPPPLVQTVLRRTVTAAL